MLCLEEVRKMGYAIEEQENYNETLILYGIGFLNNKDYYNRVISVIPI